MATFTGNLRAYGKLTALVCVGILGVIIIYGLFSLITPRVALTHALQALGLTKLADTISVSPKDVQNYNEVIPYHHEAVRSWITGCIGFGNVTALPLRIRDTLTLHQFETYQTAPGPDQLPHGTRMPNRGEQALNQLSKTLAVQRIALRSRVNSTYVLWQSMSLIAIALGMVTTILVSVSTTLSSQNGRQSPLLLRILVIVFPALGTAVAAIIAFYSPQAEWSQASRTLVSMTQLHDQVALGVWNLPCPKTEDDEGAKRLTTTVEDWVKRYNDIQTTSNTTSEALGTGKQGSSNQRPPNVVGTP